MRVVLDASAALAMAFHEPEADKLRKAVAAAEWIETPDLFVAETANACWKRHQQGHSSLEHCEIALTHSIGLPDQFVPAETLHREAFSLGVNARRSVYDMFYLVLARRNNAALLSTDKGLIAFAAQQRIRTLK